MNNEIIWQKIKMKQFSIFFLLPLFLTSCTPAVQEPTVTSIPTLTATITPIPTSTSKPTATAIPALPTSIEFVYDEAISDNIVTLVKTTVHEAYWYYINLGCSPNGFQVKITTGESGEVIAIDAFKVGWQDLKTNPSVMAARVSHETAHVMCQFAFTKHLNMGLIDLRWLTEGVANYFSTLEQFTNTGMNSGWRGSIFDQEIGMAEQVNPYCSYNEIPLSILEGSNADQRYPEMYAIGDVATRLLVKVNPDGFKVIINYYTYLANMPNKVAFEQAFGMTKEVFYQLYRDECRKGFPTIKNNPSQTGAIP